MNNKQVAHLWANKSRERASGSHFFFEGDTIYSYGHHFPIARHHKDTVLFTSAGYSNSTARHKSIVSHACNHLRSYTVENPTKNPNKSDVAAYKWRIDGLIEMLGKARDPRRHLDSLILEVKEANQFCAEFGFKTRFPMPSKKSMEEWVAKGKEAQQKKRKAEAVRAAKIERENVGIIQKWIAGEPVSVPRTVTSVFLRKIVRENITPCGQMIEMQTSMGALVPLAEAKKAFRFSMLHREKGWKRNGDQFKVGDFQLDAVTSFGVIAGCHKIAWCEIERFAKTQKWI